jgi:hypothetical protein
MKCPAPFFIWFHHRSGSTHLTSLLDSHPAITCWKELFYRGERAAADDLFTRSRAPSADVFLDHVYSYRWGPEGANLSPADPRPPLPRAVGFKLKYQQAAVYPRVLDSLRGRSGIKVIHLVRTNLLAALASAALVPRLWERFGRPHLLAGESPDGIEWSVRLDPRTVIAELEELEARIDEGRRALAEFEVLEITYEELLNAQAATCRTVLEFLGVDAAPDLTSRYAKVLPRSLRQTLTNADEVAAALAGSRFAPFLEVG